MTAIASVEKLTIHYGKRVAVDDLSLELGAGEIVLLLGPNGAGKSTTLAAMAGALAPSAGRIAIGSEDLATAPRAARRRVGFADQPPALYEFLTVSEHLAFVAEARGDTEHARLEWVVDDLGLRPVARRLIRELSYGYRQRVGLAAALVGQTNVLLLDETLNGLDPHAARAARSGIPCRPGVVAPAAAGPVRALRGARADLSGCAVPPQRGRAGLPASRPATHSRRRISPPAHRRAGTPQQPLRQPV